MATSSPVTIIITAEVPSTMVDLILDGDGRGRVGLAEIVETWNEDGPPEVRWTIARSKPAAE
jgi:hypothetical protein